MQKISILHYLNVIMLWFKSSCIYMDFLITNMFTYLYMRYSEINDAISIENSWSCLAGITVTFSQQIWMANNKCSSSCETEKVIWVVNSSQKHSYKVIYAIMKITYACQNKTVLHVISFLKHSTSVRFFISSCNLFHKPGDTILKFLAP